MNKDKQAIVRQYRRMVELGLEENEDTWKAFNLGWHGNDRHSLAVKEFYRAGGLENTLGMFGATFGLVIFAMQALVLYYIPADNVNYAAFSVTIPLTLGLAYMWWKSRKMLHKAVRAAGQDYRCEWMLPDKEEVIDE